MLSFLVSLTAEPAGLLALQLTATRSLIAICFPSMRVSPVHVTAVELAQVACKWPPMEDACTPATTAENIKKGLGIYYDPTCSDTGCGVGELCHAACEPFFLRDILPRDGSVPW